MATASVRGNNAAVLIFQLCAHEAPNMQHASVVLMLPVLVECSLSGCVVLKHMRYPRLPLAEGHRPDFVTSMYNVVTGYQKLPSAA
jgi:hypothetical protein